MDERTPPADGQSGPSTAQTHEIFNHRIVAIEHPCIIKNFDNGFKSLGGEPRMKNLLDHHVGDSTKFPLKPLPEPEVTISLRPHDPWAQKLSSQGIKTHNVLLKVNVPRRTGRKRKRGSEDLFEHPAVADSSNTSITAPELLKRIRDSEGSYSVEPVGMVRETHRFRNSPDFQMRATDVPIFQELERHALKPSYDALKQFHIDLSPGSGDIKAFPGPPRFATVDIPQRYEYQQAAGVRFTTDEHGNLASTNTQAGPRKVVVAIAADAEEVPSGPPPDLKVANMNGTHLGKVVESLRNLLDERPLVTRRVAMNYIPHVSDTVFKEATQYVGYNFKAGPWRDALIKYGIDPRKDPKYRLYQTLMFQLDKRAARASGDKTGKWNRSIRHVPDGFQNKSHVFDGEHVTLNGKTWQICDVTDPVLAKVFATTDFPTECDVHHYGWYHSGTICKARIIMRDKMEKLFEGVAPPNEDYEAVGVMPDNINDDTVGLTYLDRGRASDHAISMSHDIRALVKYDVERKRRLIKAGMIARRAKGEDDVNPSAGAGEMHGLREATIDGENGDYIDGDSSAPNAGLWDPIGKGALFGGRDREGSVAEGSIIDDEEGAGDFDDDADAFAEEETAEVRE